MQAKAFGQSVLLAALLSLPGTALAQQNLHDSQHHSYRVTSVVEGLEHPWSLAFLPDGDMLVSERPGRLRVIEDGTLLDDPVSGLPDIRGGGQGGLLDVVPHPDFAANRWLYISYSKAGNDGQGTTAVARGRLENNRLRDVEDIFVAEAWDEGRGHYGSRLAFDSDNHLFISIGDRQAPPEGNLQAHPAQNTRNHQGTIVRLHDDGSIPEDNPFVGDDDVLPEIWSYGHRNIQGMTVDPRTDAVWATEHGQQGGDELNRAEAGHNYGWPVIGFGVNYGAGTPIHERVNHEDMEHPVMHWTPSIGPSGLMIYSGERFPEWQGDLFAGGMAGGYRELTRITTDGAEMLNRESLLPGEYRIRDVRQGPDGYIYLVIDDREGGLTPILRLEPAM